MAVALKTRLFDNIQLLTAYCVAGGNNVTTVVQIVHDASSSKWVLFYT